MEDEGDPRCSVWDCIPRPWNDWSPQARWLSTVWNSNDEWITAHGGLATIHPVFTLMGVTFWMLMADSLHIMEIGVAHRVVANVLFHIVFNRCFLDAATVPGRLDQLWALILAGYRRLQSGCQLGHLTLAMFCNSQGPASHQPSLSSTIKAAETKSLVPVLLDIFRALRRAQNAVDGHVMGVLVELNTYYQVLSNNKRCLALPVVEQLQLENALWNLNRHYSALEAWAIGLGLLRWGTTIKFHMALHLALQSRFTNPSLTWTYMDEDFMSIVKSVGESCAKGTPAHKIVPKVCERYLVGMGVRIGFAFDLEALD